MPLVMPPDSYFEYPEDMGLPVPNEKSVQAFHDWYLGEYGLDLPADLATEMFSQMVEFYVLTGGYELSRRNAYMKEQLGRQIEEFGIGFLAPDERELWAALNPEPREDPPPSPDDPSDSQAP